MKLRRALLPGLAALLILFVAILGFFQYRWLGEVSAAEGDRMRAALRGRSGAFARELDREVTRAVRWLGYGPGGRDAGPVEAALAERWRRWQEQAPQPRLVRAVYRWERKDEQASGT